MKITSINAKSIERRKTKRHSLAQLLEFRKTNLSHSETHAKLISDYCLTINYFLSFRNSTGVIQRYLRRDQNRIFYWRPPPLFQAINLMKKRVFFAIFLLLPVISISFYLNSSLGWTILVLSCPVVYFFVSGKTFKFVPYVLYVWLVLSISVFYLLSRHIQPATTFSQIHPFVVTLFSLFTSLVAILIVLLAFFYLSSEWVLGLSGFLGVTWMHAMMFLFSRVSGMQQSYIILADGKVSVASHGNIMSKFGGPGLIIVRPLNAAVLELSGDIKRIVGPGLYHTEMYEEVKEAIDLRPQEGETTVIEVPTREGVPLTLTVRYRYQIETKKLMQNRERMIGECGAELRECLDILKKHKKYAEQHGRYNEIARDCEKDKQECIEEQKKLRSATAGYDNSIKKCRRMVKDRQRIEEECEEVRKMRNIPRPNFWEKAKGKDDGDDGGGLEGARDDYSWGTIWRAVYHAQPEGWHVATEHAIAGVISDQVGKLGLHEIFGSPENPLAATPGMLRMIADNARFHALMRTAYWGVSVTALDIISVEVPQSVQKRISAVWAAEAESDSFKRRSVGEAARYGAYEGVRKATADKMLATFSQLAQQATTTLPPDAVSIYLSLLSRITEEVARDRVSAYRYFQTLEAMSRNPDANVIISAKDDTIIIDGKKKS